MGNLTSSCYMPSPRTTLNRLLFWCSRKLGWHEFELTDSTRSTIRVTISMDRESAPAVALRRRLRRKLNCNPGAIGILWTNTQQVTTAVTVSATHIWRHHGAELILKSLNPFTALHGKPNGEEPFSTIMNTIMNHSTYPQSTEINSTRSRQVCYTHDLI